MSGLGGGWVVSGVDLGRVLCGMRVEKKEEACRYMYVTFVPQFLM